MGHCHKRAVRSVDANRVCGPRWCRTGERRRPDAVAGEESQRPQLTTIHASPPVLAGSATDGASRTRSARFKSPWRQTRHQRCPGHCERFNLSPVQSFQNCVSHAGCFDRAIGAYSTAIEAVADEGSCYGQHLCARIPARRVCALLLSAGPHSRVSAFSRLQFVRSTLCDIGFAPPHSSGATERPAAIRWAISLPVH